MSQTENQQEADSTALWHMITNAREAGCTNVDIANLLYSMHHPVLRKFIIQIGLEKYTTACEDELDDLHSLWFDELCDGDKITISESEDGGAAEVLEAIVNAIDMGESVRTPGIAYQIESIVAAFVRTGGVVESDKSWIDSVDLVELSQLFAEELKDGEEFLGVPFTDLRSKEAMIHTLQTVADEALGMYIDGVPLVYSLDEDNDMPDPPIIREFMPSGPRIVAHADIAYHGAGDLPMFKDTSEYVFCENARHVTVLKGEGIVRFALKDKKIARLNFDFGVAYREYMLCTNDVDDPPCISGIPGKLRRVYHMLGSMPGRAFYMRRNIRVKFMKKIRPRKDQVKPDRPKPTSRGIGERHPPPENKSESNPPKEKTQPERPRAKDRKKPEEKRKGGDNKEGRLVTQCREVLTEHMTPHETAKRYKIPDDALVQWPRVLGKSGSKLSTLYLSKLTLAKIHLSTGVSMAWSLIEQKARGCFTHEFTLLLMAVVQANIAYDPCDDMICHG